MIRHGKTSPLLRIDDALDTLAGAKQFSTLDLQSVYWQVALHPEDKEKAAFSAVQGLFTPMLFGLCKAPATFDRLMETVLRGLTIVLPRVPGRRDRDWLHVPGAPAQPPNLFERFHEAHLKFNLEKFQFLQKEVRNLRHTVSPDEITTDSEKLKAVREWPTPRKTHEISSFLGLCSHYRRFIPGFVDICGTADQTHGSETSFWIDSKSRWRLPVTKGGPLYRTNACIPAAGRKVYL
jgi:hypothetical protein